jgi:hypothetical protein
MTSTTPAIWELARRLVALEAACPSEAVAGGGEAARVCEKLRAPLAKFAGVAGYRSLISRALAIAKAKHPTLESARARLDGSLEGLEEIARTDTEAGLLVLVHLLGLLVTFIGKPLTLGLVRDAWPDATLDETDSRAEEQS